MVDYFICVVFVNVEVVVCEVDVEGMEFFGNGVVGLVGKDMFVVGIKGDDVVECFESGEVFVDGDVVVLLVVFDCCCKVIEVGVDNYYVDVGGCGGYDCEFLWCWFGGWRR